VNTKNAGCKQASPAQKYPAESREVHLNRGCQWRRVRPGMPCLLCFAVSLYSQEHGLSRRIFGFLHVF
ncbi:MAG: hypothetical protein IKF55_04030, partial [Oscillospiraceae bacterium]|nr:hypothetical protein [Oscillospiraceae bacterium]